MSAVEFGDGREPWSLDRGRVRRFLHALVREVPTLPAPWQAELRDWLTSRGAEPAKSVLVTRAADGGGYRLHARGSALDVELADLPVWLQRPAPEPRPAKRTRSPKVGGGGV